MSAIHDVIRWQMASQAAGKLLERWYSKHPVVLRTIAPKLPAIIGALKGANIDRIERMLEQAGR